MGRTFVTTAPMPIGRQVKQHNTAQDQRHMALVERVVNLGLLDLDTAKATPARALQALVNTGQRGKVTLGEDWETAINASAGKASLAEDWEAE